MAKRNNNMRKCKSCGKDFNIETADYIKKNNYFHEVSCYIEYKLSKGKKLEAIEAEINKIKDTMMSEEYEKQKLVKAKGDFFDYVFAEYDLEIIPSYLYKKIHDVNQGNYGGLKSGIPYEDLLFMFKKQRQRLIKIYTANIAKGKKFSNEQRLSYDVAVIVNMYNDYLLWKRRQEVNNTSNDEKLDLFINVANNIHDKLENEVDDIISDLY